MSKKIIYSLAVGLITAVLGTQLPVAGANASERVFDPQTREWTTPVVRRLDQRKPHRKFKRRTVNIRTTLTPGTLVVHTDNKFLYHITSATKAVRYGVGVGKEGFGWNGDVKIKRKAEWPSWTPPKEMILRERAEGRELPARMEGGPENPMGARALYLYQGNADTLYRIHGTHQPWSIGLNLSSGCIRLNNKDIEHLYPKVKLGTTVKVIGPGENIKKYMTDLSSNPLAALFSGTN